MVVRTIEKRRTKESRIVETPGIVGGRPRIDGHRIRVQDVAIWYEQMGMSPEDITREYELTPAEIHAALAFYYDHRSRILRDIERDRRFAEELRRHNPSLVREKLKKLRG